MKKTVLFTIVFCLLLTLTACQKGNVADDSIANQETVSTPEQSEIMSGPDTPAPLPTKPTQAVIPQTVNVGKTVTPYGTLEDAKYSEKIAQLQGILDNHKYNISLSVYAVDGSKALYYNTESGIFGACTVKAGYTLYACKQMESGNGSLDTQITYSQKHYEPGTGDMQYSPFGTVFTMETALHKSMSISDNVGYLMSVDYFGREGYNSFISEMGCDSLQIKPTVWSLRTKSQDLVKLWCEIYNYFSTDTEYARFLKNSCTNTAGNYATAALSDVEYSHKQGHNSTGDWLSLSDAGIVWKGDTPYIIAILTDAPGPNSYSLDAFAQIIDIVHNDLF